MTFVREYFVTPYNLSLGSIRVPFQVKTTLYQMVFFAAKNLYFDLDGSMCYFSLSDESLQYQNIQVAAQFEVPLSTSDAQEVLNNNLEQNFEYIGQRGYHIQSLI